MEYAVITVVEGNFLIRSEWSDLESACKAFHSLCAALITDTGFSNAMVKVMDENLDTVKMEYIIHDVVSAPVVEEPVEE